MGSNLDRGSTDPKFTRHIDKVFPTLGQLVAAGEAARSLIEHPGWDALHRMLEAEVASIDRLLDSDRPLESRAAYAGWHGRRGGLKAPELALHALVSRAESRLAEQRAKHENGAATVPGGST